jgi:plastocyanin
MKNTIASLVAVSFLSSVSMAAVTGSVSFSGAAPKAEAIKMTADPACAKANAGKTVMKEDVVVNANKTLANVFVYVKEGVKKESVPAAPTTPVKFDQSGCHYIPHVLGVRVGQPFEIINSDAVMHNVHSMSKQSNSFNMGMATQGQKIEKKLAKPEMMMKVKCDVHGWMTAYVNVMEHPYFAVTDTTGAFNIDGLPDGEYTFEALHEKLGAKTAKGKVAGGVAKVDFAF